VEEYGNEKPTPVRTKGGEVGEKKLIILKLGMRTKCGFGYCKGTKSHKEKVRGVN